VDLIAEGLDAAIAGGLELAPGVVSRTLAPLHIRAHDDPVKRGKARRSDGSVRPFRKSGEATA